ncbi:MAG: ABC transporter permease [Alphaproteobacteria bacterium]
MKKIKDPDALPASIEFLLIPLINLILAFFVAGVVVLLIAENPFHAIGYLFLGAFGSLEGFGYTLYYATSFIFAGLAVGLAFQGKLFNIGGEGQGLMGGIGATLVVLAFDHTLPAYILLPLAIIAAAAFGAIWGLIAGWIQAYRNGHIVITTIMLNFIAAGILSYLLANFLKKPGGSTETREFLASGQVPSFIEPINKLFPNAYYSAPLNWSFILALILCAVYWWYVWHTKWGYQLRAVGQNEEASLYAGINSKKQILITMLISAAFAGLIAINVILGETHSLKPNFVFGAGFTGIAVALMGRNHPVGIVFAAILFGALQQGGTELQFNIQRISPYFVYMLMGLVVFFSGALAYQFYPFFLKRFPNKRFMKPQSQPATTEAKKGA